MKSRSIIIIVFAAILSGCQVQSVRPADPWKVGDRLGAGDPIWGDVGWENIIRWAKRRKAEQG